MIQGKGQFFRVVRPIQKHWQYLLLSSLRKGSIDRQQQHAADWIIQYSIQAEVGSPPNQFHINFPHREKSPALQFGHLS